MKKVFFLLLAGILLAGFARGATLSGTVINATTFAPISGQGIFIHDSTYSYIDSAVTNSSGFYSVTLPGAVAYNLIVVQAGACGVIYQNRPTYTGGNITSNFSVCPTTTYTIHGTISLGGTANNGLARVYLIRKSYDSTLMDTVLTLVDSITTAATGGTYTKTYTTMPYGNLILKAALLPSHPSYSSFLPTYYTSSLVWSNAFPVSSGNFLSSSLTNITMIAGSNPGGPGFIGGSVLVGANKRAAVGDPLPGRILLLTNATGQAVKYTYSGTDGKFSFSGLNYGTYKIFGDAWGKTNPALTFTVTQANSGSQQIIFDENDTAFRGRIITVTAVANTTLTQMNVYPNPAVTDRIMVSGSDAIAGTKTAVLTDIRGAVLQRLAFAAGQIVELATGNLAAGVYLLQLHTQEGAANFRVLK